jgi:transcriptional regulatory protein RtcR
VAREVARLQRTWQQRSAEPTTPTPLTVTAPLPTDTALDEFDAVQLQHVLAVCRRSETLAEAGRALFAVSRQQKKTKNDTDRLRKYLLSYGLDPDAVSRASG